MHRFVAVVVAEVRIPEPVQLGGEDLDATETASRYCHSFQ